MARVLKCDGYEMFHGSFLVCGVRRVSGDWVHVPKWKNDGYACTSALVFTVQQGSCFRAPP